MLTRKTDSKAVNYGVATWFNYTELCLSALLPRSLGKFRRTLLLICSHREEVL